MSARGRDSGEATAVPAYEVVLPDVAREEVRLSDQPLATGEAIKVDGREWVVTGEEARHSLCTRRFVVVPRTGSPRNGNQEAIRSADRRRR